ncbi:glutamyl-tRNA amidotransferase subunit A [Annulohypoxylon truncatum]|uniref:glutamyl-tRNA amidotransferase subunit A n=1 Tax=Annulohypoxylon truncatum TaxID=327061 RepID=UPI002007B37D|nr:glutamyl-tRNA amidotransferase subunit A [Annulohypoxylon truncatum]KAI1208534.1 glutamyl-tRNA amidotransferase subunit A [Annulohypoxylon truncatum]
MEPHTKQKLLSLYPEPIRAPETPYIKARKRNPRLRGWALIAVSFLTEWLGFVRWWLWRNAGFGSLGNLREYIEHVEPRFDPTVFPTENDITGATPAESGVSHSSRDIPLEPENPIPVQGRYSVAHYRSLYLSGALTPLAVVQAILPLIRRDTSPPGEHSAAWLQIRVDLVIEAAKASTLRYQKHQSLGPLDGIPTAVKDEYDIEGYTKSLGSIHDCTAQALNDERIDSWCVKKLEEAGAIILGKLSMHEFGMDTCGVNISHGTPLNPYNQHYYTGGSSSGSAYAVAAGLIPIAMGNDGGGSIRVPSSFCSVFGLKTSLGRISYHPSFNASSTSAVCGPIAADMRSLAELYSVASQPHPLSCFPPPSPSIRGLTADPNRPKVIGLPEAWFQSATPAIQTLCRGMIDWLVTYKGYTVKSINIPFIAESKIAHALTMLTNASTLVHDTRGFSPANRILFALGRVTPATDYLLAQKLRRVLMQHLSWLWNTYPGMIIVTPTTACEGWPIRAASELKYGISDGDQTLDSMEYVWLANFCGVPSLTVPAGYVVPEGQPGEGEIAGPNTEGKVPVGLMATGEWTREDTLILFGVDAEEAGAKWQCRPPTWVDVIELAKKEMKNE